MSLHMGKKYIDSNVVLGPGDVDMARKNNPVNYTEEEWESWRVQAEISEDIYYFSIYYGDNLIGELFLHDINLEKASAMLGYHIFAPTFRGKGIGTIALGLLQKFVKEQNKLDSLIIITAESNYSSRKIAEKCEFQYIGHSRENQKMLVYEWTA